MCSLSPPFLSFPPLQLRPSVKADNPEFTLMDMSKQLGVLWKDVSEEDRKPYQDKAAADKIR